MDIPCPALVRMLINRVAALLPRTSMSHWGQDMLTNQRKTAMSVTTPRTDWTILIDSCASPSCCFGLGHNYVLFRLEQEALLSYLCSIYIYIMILLMLYVFWYTRNYVKQAFRRRTIGVFSFTPGFHTAGHGTGNSICVAVLWEWTPSCMPRPE